MNARTPPEALATLPLADLAWALLADPSTPAAPGSEAAWLAERARRAVGVLGREPLDPGADGAELWARWRAQPPLHDQALAALAVTLVLSPAETLAVALVVAAETDALAARALSWLQTPVGGARPTVGLVLQVAAALGAQADGGSLAALAAGAARASGLLRLDDEQRVLAEAALTVPQPIVLALASPPRLHWPGLRLGGPEATPLPPSLQAAAGAQARALDGVGLAPGSAGPALVVRSGHAGEAQAAAADVARQLRARAVFVDLRADDDVPVGLGPWLWLAAAVPVLRLELAPGERRRIAPIPGWHGPVLLACGPDGAVEFDGDTAPSWCVPLPTPEERVALWQQQLGDAAAAATLGLQHAHGAGRIAELARAARFQARMANLPLAGRHHVVQAARSGSAGDLGALAELMTDPVPAEALVLPAALRAELEAFAARCLQRDRAALRLGPAARARFRAGVRALFVGPSGTGKSLAVGWLATALGLPLFRVDLASVTSKYIGETEKNLAQLFARAERAEVVLMFDEADALFGRRTEVKDSNDRFANAQTNYLLSRIESYEGIAVLTSNSRARFDSAFTRRLDVILEFPPPSPGERRALWLAHLGQVHALDDGQINRLAAGCELAGGHVRNVVLAAAARARDAPIGMAELVAALAAEYAKLGKPLPSALAPAREGGR